MKSIKIEISFITKVNIFECYPFKLFNPNKYIIREEMIAVLTRAKTFTIICKLMGLYDEHTKGLED